MKRTICILLLAGAAALPAAAQGWYDAYLFSQNHYGGTARSAAMGNAMTAVGGDPGSIGINPAGSAVSSYSQVFITPGYTLSSAYAVGTMADLDGQATTIGYGDGLQTIYGRMKLPNVGQILVFDTGRRTGLKRLAMGIALNSTQDFTGRFNAGGVNRYNSYAASLASSADGFSADDLGQGTWDYVSDPAHCPTWVDMVGYRSYMINGVTGRPGTYLALTESMDGAGNFRLAAPIYQQYGRQTRGFKYDWALNLSANISDRLYLGANLGIVALNYRCDEYWYEAPETPADFPDIQFSDGSSSRFESLRMKRNYQAKGGGVYLKAGFLAHPFAGLRIGAAIQTPTMMNITERYAYSGEVSMSNDPVHKSNSPEDEWEYQLKSPFRANVGLAYTFGRVAVLSVDYEMAYYDQCHFYDADGYENGSFNYANQDIKNLLCRSDALRVGFELKPMEQLAIRAGYNFASSGIHNDFSSLQLASFGLGYSSAGSFYIDGALRFRFLPQEYLIPYYYYTSVDGQPFYVKDVDEGVLTPEISVKSMTAEALVTLGWRF